jgi:putative alpha-1,2-mannosidase
VEVHCAQAFRFGCVASQMTRNANAVRVCGVAESTNTYTDTYRTLGPLEEVVKLCEVTPRDALMIARLIVQSQRP